VRLQGDNTIMVETYGCAVARVANDATAFGNRVSRNSLDLMCH